MSTRRFLVLQVLTVAALAVCPSVWAAEGDPPSGIHQIGVIEGITEYRLENGLQILLLPDDSKPTVTVNITYFVGSRHEGYGEAGMAHLLEHMLFKGTPNNPNIPAALKERGGDFNGTTWYDRTNYYETFPASAENLEFALRLEADRMVNSHVAEADLKSEMTVVRNEFELGENSPELVLSQRLFASAFEWHGYGRSTIGNRSDIERVPIKNLQSFYQRHYRPDNALLIVAGKFDASAALEQIVKYYGDLEGAKNQAEETYTEEPTQDGERSVRLRRVGSAAFAGVLYHIPAGGHEDFQAVEVLQRILTTEVSGRLYKSLVQTKLAAEVGGATLSLHDPGALEIIAKAASGTDPAALLAAMLATIDETAREGVTEDEVNRVRGALLKERELSAANSTQLAIELSDWAAQGDWRLYFLDRDRLEQVTAQQVSAVASKYLKADNRTVGVFEPTGAPDRSAIPQVVELRKTLEGYRGREEVASGEQFDSSPANIDQRTTSVTLRSGVKAALLPKRTRGNSVTLRLALHYGTAESLTGARLAAELLPEMLTRGTKALTRQQIDDELDRLRATLSVTGRPGELVVSIQARQQTLPEVLQLLRQILREPALPAEEFELLKQGKLGQLESALTDPQALALNAVRRRLSNFPAADPRHVPTLPAEIAEVKEISLESVSQLYANFLGGEHGELSVVGDFDSDTVASSVESLLDGWKSAEKYQRINRVGGKETAGGREQIQTPDKENAVYFGAQVLKLKDSDPDYAALELGNFILGGGGLSSRLMDRIRQKEGLSYGVQSILQSSALEPRTLFMMFAISNPMNMEKTETAIREEITRLLDAGIDADELQAARQGWLQEQQVARANDPLLAAVLGTNLQAGRTMQHQRELEAKIESLTAEEVRAALRKYIDVRKVWGASAGDFKKKP